MSGSDIRLAGPGDTADVVVGLKGLARDLGDPFNATEPSIAEALSEPYAVAFAILAGGKGDPQGVIFASAAFSTVQGGAYAYISDLWVAPDARGCGLGRALVAAAAREAAKRWKANALRLTFYDSNAKVMPFYRELGFEMREFDNVAGLAGEGFKVLAGEAG